MKFGEYNGTPLTWKIYDITALSDGYATVGCDQSIGNLKFDFSENSDDSANPVAARRDYGNNRYGYSNIRQILNSDGEKNNWFEKTHIYDSAPDYASTKNGFLHEFTDFEKGIIVPVEVKTNLDAADGGGVETVIDKVWIPSKQEVGLETSGEGHMFAGFSGGNSKRTFLADWWLRTIYPGTDSHVCYVKADGSLGLSGASGNRNVRPFCAISATAYVMWSDADNAYILADDAERNGNVSA